MIMSLLLALSIGGMKKKNTPSHPFGGHLCSRPPVSQAAEGKIMIYFSCGNWFLKKKEKKSNHQAAHSRFPFRHIIWFLSVRYCMIA